MDCGTVNDRLAAFLDGELAPAEARWVEEHLGTCESCCAKAEAFAEQNDVLSSLGHGASCVREPEFWAQMDANLAPHLASLQQSPPPLPFWRKEFRISSVGVLAYAAALLLALGFAYERFQALENEKERVQTLENELQRAERLAAEPPPLHGQPYRAVSYAPDRGHL